MGHALPGTIFIIGGIWWALNSLYLYFRSRTKNGQPYRARVYFGFQFFGLENVCVDGIFIILVTAVGIVGELVTAFDHGEFEHLGNGQHMTMYFFFFLAGVCELLVHYKFMLPEGTEVAIGMLAYAMEGILFYFHLHGRTTMDKQVHMMLFISIMFGMLAIWIELKHQNYVLATLGRAYFTLLQGTWFYQVGFILYPPFPGMAGWDQEDHSQMMIITMMYTWHCAANFLLLAFFSLATGLYFKMKYPNDFRTERIVYQQLSLGDRNPPRTKANGHVDTKLIDSDSDGV